MPSVEVQPLAPAPSEIERVQLTLELSRRELTVIADAVGRLLDARVAALVGEALDARPDRDPARLLCVNEVAEHVGVSRRTVYRALSSGALAGEVVATHWRVRSEAIDAWLSVSRTPGRPAPGASVGVLERRPPRRPAGEHAPPASFRERAQSAGARRPTQPTGKES